MDRCKPPTSATSPTPFERSSWTRTILSAISVSSRAERLPVTATDSVGD
jgi:hypothetical protein